MITTKTRGVGLNRNVALLAADHEFLLLADDDVRYQDDMPEQVEAAFQKNLKADVIIFGLDLSRNGVVYQRVRPGVKRLHIWNSMRYGTCVIALRRKSLLQSGLSFSHLFGGGSLYGAGEDSLFLKACFDRGLKVYGCSYVLGECCKDKSSWFSSCDGKYFYDKGALIGKLFPRMPYLAVLIFGTRFRKSTDISWPRRIVLMVQGLRGGRKLVPYGALQK